MGSGERHARVSRDGTLAQVRRTSRARGRRRTASWRRRRRSPQLAAATAALDRARTVLSQGLEAPMPLVHIDAAGLSTSGAVLAFTSTQAAPVLVDGSDGRVRLYLRGVDDALRGLAYDTLTDRARLLLTAGTGGVSLVARTVDFGTQDTAPAP